MNRLCYRLVFNRRLGALVAVAETAHGRGKAASGGTTRRASALLGGLLLGNAFFASPALAELPVPSAGFVKHGQVGYQVNGNQAFVNQVGNKSILNWQKFNVSPGASVQFRQVNNLTDNQLVSGASFTSLNRIWDINPSVIAGSISQGAGQKANVILVNTNGIAFIGGAQVNLNSFTASSLDIADKFVTESLLPAGNTTAQFQGSTGFVKVLEGAQITAGEFGRVMLLAPTVVNRGTVTAPDGQVILAAGSKVYLTSAGKDNPDLNGLLVEIDNPDTLTAQDTPNTGVRNGELDGQTVALTNAADDKLGQATNWGTLSTPRGNITMMGFAVNQSGIARATTSVVSNGSIYLHARDRTVDSNGVVLTAGSSGRGGRVTLGSGSITEVLPEVGDSTATTDTDGNTGLDRRSLVDIAGQDVRVSSGATIAARSGDVNLFAADTLRRSLPSTSYQTQINEQIKTPYTPSNTARVHISDGATIDVSGLEDVAVSVARNTVKVELRGDELKDSPVNRNGTLRGETVYVDVNRALANADAGVDTLIAEDSLEAYADQQTRTVAERSTAAGTVNVKSTGEAIVESGATIDLSGGNLKYTAGTVETTLLIANGKKVDISDARADVAYTGIATKYEVSYDRWNVTETIDLGKSYRYDPGYLEGKNAGTMTLFGMGATVMQGNIEGRTTVGELQRASGKLPAGAKLVIGLNDSSLSGLEKAGVKTNDFKINQDVLIGGGLPALSTGFDLGDTLPAEQRDVLALSTDLLGEGKVASLEVLSNQAVTVRNALRTPVGGSVSITGSSVQVNADIMAAGGSVALTARNTAGTVPESLSGALPTPALQVADGVNISTAGTWVNDLPTRAGATNSVTPVVDGGSISLRAEVLAGGATLISTGVVDLGEGVRLDASAGAWMQGDGDAVLGDGGSITVAGYAVEGLSIDTATAHGFGDGGSLSLQSRNVFIGGTPDSAEGSLNLTPDWFNRGGFQSHTVTAVERLELAAGTTLAPRVQNLQLDTTARAVTTGASLDAVSQVLTRPVQAREATELTLQAGVSGASNGELVLQAGSRIDMDAGGLVSLSAGNKVQIEGSVRAQGGSIDVELSQSSSVASTTSNLIWLGDAAELDASGTAVSYVDGKGLVQGERLDGGTVSLTADTGSIVTRAGSVINVSGAAPSRLDELNEQGGVGRTAGTDAGTVNLTAITGGALLDGQMLARGGSAQDRSGTLSVTLGDDDPSAVPAQPDVAIRLASSVADQTAGLSADSVVSYATPVRIQLGADDTEAAGFDRVQLHSRDDIALADGLNLGANRSLPMRELTLDAARIRTEGGDVTLRAETVRLANDEYGRLPAAAAVTNSTGQLTVNAAQVELAGDLVLAGMGATVVNASESITLVGVASTTTKPTGELTVSGDLTLNAGTIAPTSYTDYVIEASGHTVRFGQGGEAAQQPYSALGSLTVRAQDIVQGGNLWAPFGVIDLQASGDLTLTPGSLTSVAAAEGSVTPLGKVANGRLWVYDVNAASTETGKLEIETLGEKAIRLKGAKVDTQAGAKVDVAGGGEVQAYEVTVGPGGSRDILSDAGTYAIIPGYTGGVAPSDAQEGQTFDRSVGEAIYLSGVPGLADGVYTLLPAHYALLPGAYAVKLDGSSVLPGQTYTRQDGVAVAAGYLTDSRTGATRDSQWQGVQVLTQTQVKDRTEFTLTQASDFFSQGSLPQDAGLLSVAATQAAADALRLNASFNFKAGSGGQAAALDLSAPEILLADGSSASGATATTTVLDVNRLNALGAGSVFIGGTRSTADGVTTLDVQAQTVTLANDAGSSLKASEVMLAALDTLQLNAGSRIDAQGAVRDDVVLATEGDGALLRAGTSQATLDRTGTVGQSRGVLNAEAGSTVVASGAVLLDATRELDSDARILFQDEKGQATAGSLTVGAERINFGDAPDAAQGITYSQTQLDALAGLGQLTLTSYSSFDLYGDVSVGQTGSDGRATMKDLTLKGAGLAGIDNAGQTASIRAQNLTLSNASNASFTPGGTLGSGALDIVAQKLTLAQGSKAIQGFSQVNIQADDLVGSGTGQLNVAAPTTVSVARISGQAGSNQTLASSGQLTVAERAASRALAAVTDLGARWALQGQSVDFNARAELPSGQLALVATTGDLTVGSQARVDVAGREVAFYDTSEVASGGVVSLTATAGNVSVVSGALIDISAADGGDGGSLQVQAVNGTVAMASGTLKAGTQSANGETPDGAAIRIDAASLGDFTALATTLAASGASGSLDLRQRSGDLDIAAGTTLAAKDIQVAVDNGNLTVGGTVSASGTEAGEVRLLAGNHLTLIDGAQVSAAATGAGEAGGTVLLSSGDGAIDLQAGSLVDVSAGENGRGGTVHLRALRTGVDATNTGGTDVAITALAGELRGKSALNIEAVKRETASSLDTALLSTINTQNTSFATHHSDIKDRLGIASDAQASLLSGVEVQSTGDMTLSNDWNLNTARAGGEAGVLTLRAGGSLNINNNLSDGFSTATTAGTLGTSADGWSYRLVAGADLDAADALAVSRSSTANLNLAAGKLVRTGTGDIDMASGGNITLASNTSAVYTAGRVADAVAGFTTPISALKPVFAQDGGDLSMAALGDIVGKPSTQLYSEWLWRQGAISDSTGDYTKQPAWWVRHDLFAQGVGTLGGGDVSIRAGGKVQDLSANAATNGRVSGTNPGNALTTVTGGGDLSVTAGTDLLGGQYYVGAGELKLRAGGEIGAGTVKINTDATPLAPVLALGDAQADVQAGGDLTIQAVVNPQVLLQTSANFAIVISNRVPARSIFSTYSDAASVSLTSLYGDVTLVQDLTSLVSAYPGVFNPTSSAYNTDDKDDAQRKLVYLLPPTLEVAALQGNVTLGSANLPEWTLQASSEGDLRVLAAGSIDFQARVGLSDKGAAQTPTPEQPLVANATGVITAADRKAMLINWDVQASQSNHATTPVHGSDATAAQVYAVSGDISGAFNATDAKQYGGIFSAKPVSVHAGQDVRDLTVIVQHADASQLSEVVAGRDIVFTTGTVRRDSSGITVNGPGTLDVTAGRNIDLGASAGIVSRGNLDNASLPTTGADIHLAAGVGSEGLQLEDAVTRLLAKLEAGASDESTLWQARWLTGNDDLDAAGAVSAVRAVAGENVASQRSKVREMLYTALRETGRDYNDAASEFAGDYARGYDALELVFPGVSKTDSEGHFVNYEGGIDLFASRVKTERGGNIDFLVPGGDLVVGLPNTPDTLVDVGANVLGMVAASTGDIRGFSRGDMLVNQSRILTVGGGDVLLWSSEGDIDAGKGKKTASAVPPPLISVDLLGNVTQVLQGAVTGSGIGALSTGDITAGDVDLIAPKGTVNAGDAGIRAGNLNIAALTVLGADNISVSGSTTGAPVADTSAVTAASSGATSGGDDSGKVVEALNQAAAESAKAAQELAAALRPYVVRVEVLGYGN